MVVISSNLILILNTLFVNTIKTIKYNKHFLALKTFHLLERLSASSMEEGSFFPRVSGKNMKTRMPPIKDPVPMMRRGKGPQTASRRAI